MAEAAVGNAPQSGLSSPSGVGLLFRNGFCLSGKANLHPLAFYTINVTSPSGHGFCVIGSRILRMGEGKKARRTRVSRSLPSDYLSVRTKLTTVVSFLPTVTFFSQVFGSEKTGR